jgi:hypothetical protein
MEMRGHTFSLAAGNVYDERMLEAVFGLGNAAELLSRNRQVRDNARMFKERHLANLFTEKISDRQTFELSGSELLTPLVRSEEDFLKLMEPYFVEAFSEPLSRLAAARQCHQIDQILLSGRGIQAVGCRERVLSDVRRFFESATSLKPITEILIPAGDRQWAVARGALTYGRGEVLIRDGDRASSRDVTLMVDVGAAPEFHLLLESGSVPGEIKKFLFDRSVVKAWIVAGGSPLPEDSRALAFGRLMTGEAPGSNLAVLDVFAPPIGCRELVVQVASDGEASFVPSLKMRRVGASA